MNGRMKMAPRTPRYLKTLDTRNAWKISPRMFTEVCTVPAMWVMASLADSRSVGVSADGLDAFGWTWWTASDSIRSCRKLPGPTDGS